MEEARCSRAKKELPCMGDSVVEMVSIGSGFIVLAIEGFIIDIAGKNDSWFFLRFAASTSQRRGVAMCRTSIVS